MQTAPSPSPRDPDFDRPALPGAQGPGRDVVHFYQRLLVNPFLAVIALMLVLAVANALWRASGSNLAGPVIWAGILAALLLTALLSLQYHCLDCGATGWFRRWRRHACPRVVERWQTPFSAASRLFPNPNTQLVLWLFVLFGWLAIVWTTSR